MTFQNSKLGIGFYLKSALTFRYLSNLSIIVTILSYYMNAFDIFFIFAPLVFVNMILIIIVQILNYDEFIEGILGKNKENNSTSFVIFLNLWHILPVLWLLYILQNDDIIKIFHPNFMGMFLSSIMIPIIYYYFESKSNVYGNINYLGYLILYILTLLGTCIGLYTK